MMQRYTTHNNVCNDEEQNKLNRFSVHTHTHTHTHTQKQKTKNKT
jgi:hypothetical protein